MSFIYTPPFLLTYYKPWDESSNIFDSWSNYCKDVSLANYSANIISDAIEKQSIKNFNAIRDLSRRIGGSLDKISMKHKGFIIIDHNLFLCLEICF
mgnify:CR=1 FL=1